MAGNSTEYNSQYYEANRDKIAERRRARRNVERKPGAVDLKAIRAAADIGPTELAQRLGLSPRTGAVTVALTEGRDDWRLSTLAAYFKACGAMAELIVTVEGEEFNFTIA